MSACTFFGHRDCPSSVKESLYAAVEGLICNQQVDTFYVGTQGSFDRMAYAALVKLRRQYSHIKVYRVLAYMPKLSIIEADRSMLDDTILPEGIEKAHPRYAIIKRNNWMIDRSDYVICYVTHPTGGAYQAVERAKNKSKTIIAINH